jgi:hypothetical protein
MRAALPNIQVQQRVYDVFVVVSLGADGRIYIVTLHAGVRGLCSLHAGVRGLCSLHAGVRGLCSLFCHCPGSHVCCFLL